MTPLPPSTEQALAHTGTQMLAAARLGDWTEVRRLESVAQRQVQALRQRSPRIHDLPPAQRRARLEALKALLRLDAEIRRLAEPGWVRVESWLAPSRRGQDGAYSADTQGKH